jgi:hypothetical protein
MDNLPFLHPDIWWLIAFGFAMAGVCGLVGFILALPILLWPKVVIFFKGARSRQLPAPRLR